jgi:hypothetical protein
MRQSGGGGWSLLSEAKSLKTTQRGPSSLSPLRLDGSHDGQAWGWPSCPVAAQGLKYLKLKPGGTIRLESTKLDGSPDSQAGGCTSCLAAKDAKWEL